MKAPNRSSYEISFKRDHECTCTFPCGVWEVYEKLDNGYLLKLVNNLSSKKEAETFVSERLSRRI